MLTSKSIDAKIILALNITYLFLGSRSYVHVGVSGTLGRKISEGETDIVIRCIIMFWSTAYSTVVP